MAIVAHSHPFVIGVDTHARNHALSILVCPQGELLDEGQFPATTAGLARAVAFVARRTGGDVAVLWVIEGTGTYGARLARVVADAGYEVVEAPRMNARADRGIGKSDPLDARRIAAAALPLQVTALRHPRADDGVRAAVRVLLAARDHMSTERTATINALTALLRVADLGIDARRPLTGAQITTVAGWRTREEPLAVSTARWEAARLAKRVAALDDELKDITKRISDLLHQSPASVLLEQPGIGPITAARRPHRVVPPGTHPIRVRLRQPRRREPDPGLLRQHGPPPHQPRRRPAPEPRAAHGRRHPHAHGPPHPRLRRTPKRRRTHPPRDPPKPQALPRPRDLPPP